MKKSLGLILRITSYILTTILLVSTLIGCSDNEVNSPDVLESADWVSTIPFDIPNHIYDIESSPFPKFPLSDGSKRDTRNHIIEDDVIFFTAIGDIRKYTQTNDTDEIIVNNSDDYIFSINIKDMEATKLPGYTPSVPPESVIEEETALHRTRISAMHIDNDKAFYIIENLFIETYTLPESMYTYIRKLDSTGKDLIEPIPVSEIVNINDRQQVIATDSQGNIYLGLSDQDKSQVHILNPNGELRFSLNVPQMFQNHLISMPNGNVALFNFAGDMGSELTEIDVASGSWGEKKIVTSNRVFPLQGSAGYPLIFYDFNKTKLSGYNPDNDEITELLNFTDSGIVFDLISGADILNDGRILLITDTINEETDKIDYSVLQVTASIFDPSEIAILTLAAIDSSIILDMEIHKAVAEFNRASTTHFIQVINYAMNKSGIHYYKDEVNKLSADIIKGKIPDMLIVSTALPYSKYVSMGLLEDLYPFIDADPAVGRSSFVEGVLNASETNGNLYKLFPSFGVHTLIGNPYFVGEHLGWSMDEFHTVIKENPQADKPLGNWVTRESFFEYAHVFYIDLFIDWETGTANFDNDEFIQLLESILILPINSHSTDRDVIPDTELIATGRQIIDMFYLLSIDQYQAFRALFGGEIIFKGYPSIDGTGRNLLSGHSGVAMTVTCSDKDGAWDFIRSFLTDDWQRSNRANYFLPVNSVVFEEHMEKAFSKREPGGQWWDLGFDIAPITQEEATQIRNMIANTDSYNWINQDLWNIINEESSKFFRGQSTAADTARIIQNRASFLMSEQAG